MDSDDDDVSEVDNEGLDEDVVSVDGDDDNSAESDSDSSEDGSDTPATSASQSAQIPMYSSY